jgi:hypothetical protein
MHYAFAAKNRIFLGQIFIYFFFQATLLCRELNVSLSDAIDSEGLAQLVPSGEAVRCSNLLLVDLTGCWNVR